LLVEVSTALPVGSDNDWDCLTKPTAEVNRVRVLRRLSRDCSRASCGTRNLHPRRCIRLGL